MTYISSFTYVDSGLINSYYLAYSHVHELQYSNAKKNENWQVVLGALPRIAEESIIVTAMLNSGEYC